MAPENDLAARVARLERLERLAEARAKEAAGQEFANDFFVMAIALRAARESSNAAEWLRGFIDQVHALLDLDEARPDLPTYHHDERKLYEDARFWTDARGRVMLRLLLAGA